MASCKPFLKWAGGKSKLVSFIEANLPQQTRKRLIEPFAGSAALSLAVDFEAYLLNDTNPDLIHLFRILKAEKQDFIRYAHSFFTPENNCATRFYTLREQFNGSQNLNERAALFVYLNRHAFNGLCRYNSKGHFNVPFGSYQAPYFPEAEMQGFIAKAERIELMCNDFQTALSQANNGDTVYCDPPYVPLSTTAAFTAYTKSGFDLDSHKRLAEAAKQLANQTQGILISNHDTATTRMIYTNARIIGIKVQRNIAANSKSRQKVSELLAIYGL